MDCVEAELLTAYQLERVLTAVMSFAHHKYTNNATSRFVEELLARVKNLPGVQFAAVTSWIPIAGGRDRFAAGFQIEGRPAPDVANMSFVTADYFEVMGIRILQGRYFIERDVRSAGARAKIVSESFARKYFPGESPIGKRLNGVGGSGEIVGVVKDTLEAGLDVRAEPHIYHAAIPSRGAVLVVRPKAEDASLAGAIRNILLSLDKDQLKVSVIPMKQILADSIAERRFQMMILGVFSGVALLLAAVGIYGVMSYSITQRTREIGVRMVLGAQKWDVLFLMMRQGMALVLLGLLLGWAGALTSTGILRQQLFGVTPTDPWTFTGIAALLAAVALGACWLPARRATKVDPMVALRYE